MEFLEDLQAKLAEDGFNFKPIIDEHWHKIKQPIRGSYATRRFPNGVIMTVTSWDGDYKKVYKCFTNNHINGESGEIDTFVTEQIEKAQAIKKEANEKAAIEAKKIWDEESLEGDTEKFTSPYLQRKGLGSSRFGARLDSRTGAQLLVPVTDDAGKLWGIQRISPSGDKTFIKGQRKEACFHQIGNVGSTLYICEGFATGASLNLCIGDASIVAFDAGNLKRVAKIFREKYPQAQIIIAGDNDELLTGQKAAESAAKEVGGHAFYPETVGKDWNDCLVEMGKDFLTQTIKEFVDKLPTQTPKKKFDFHFQTFDEICALDLKPPTWLTKGLLPEIGTSCIFGKPKGGKSTLVRDLMVSIAEGSSFLTREVIQGKVLYIAMEENIVEMKEQLLKRGVTPNTQISKNLIIHCSTFLPINPIERLNELLSNMKGVKFVILDTLFKVLRSKDENAYQENMQLLEKVAQMAEAHKLHIMGVHHAKKGDHADGDAALGSTAITGAFDTNIFWRFDEATNQRIISSQQRYGEPFEKTVLSFDKSKYHFSIVGSVSDNRDKELVTKIWEFLREVGEPVDPKAIMANVQIQKQKLLYLLEKDVREGLIIRTGRGIPKDPKKYQLSEKLIRENDAY